MPCLVRTILYVCAMVAAVAAEPALPSKEIKIGRSVIEIEFTSGHLDLRPEAVMNWISNAVQAVSHYYGQFPVRRAQLKVKVQDGRNGVFNGMTWGREDGALTRISLGTHTTKNYLDRDWMLTHELIHYAFPSVPDENHWIEEGIATYVEPIARVQTGQLTAETVWSDMVQQMPQGEPESSDQGLDNTHTWARTYWGGALFCLVADVQIREKTHNRKGLQDAFRAILKAGGSIDADWSLPRALKIGDTATGVNVLGQLYDQMKEKPVQVDLPALWKRLGIKREGPSVVFDDRAPLAAVRRAITVPQSAE